MDILSRKDDYPYFKLRQIHKTGKPSTNIFALLIFRGPYLIQSCMYLITCALKIQFHSWWIVLTNLSDLFHSEFLSKHSVFLRKVHAHTGSLATPGTGYCGALHSSASHHARVPGLFMWRARRFQAFHIILLCWELYLTWHSHSAAAITAAGSLPLPLGHCRATAGPLLHTNTHTQLLTNFLCTTTTFLFSFVFYHSEILCLVHS